MNTTNPINSIDPKNLDNPKYFLITVDVEDWFQVENFKPWIPFETWGRRELRIEKNVHRLLDLFDSISLPASGYGSISSANTDDSAIRNDTISPKATFFVLGWVAEKLPHLVREITARGHEVASHGCNHELSSKMTASELRNDLSESRIKLEDTTGKRIIGFRAPSFAIDDKILRAVGETGYLYDSSYNSFSLQGRYGRISTNGHPKKGIAHKISGNFYEIPISNLGINHLIRAFFRRHRKKIKTVNPIANLLEVISKKGIVLPWGGGGYFRLIPNNLFMTGVDTILNEDGAYVFYLHPWEIDPGQPKMKEASLAFRFRHYNNIGRAYTKLNKLLKDFSSCLFCSCTQYLENMN